MLTVVTAGCQKTVSHPAKVTPKAPPKPTPVKAEKTSQGVVLPKVHDPSIHAEVLFTMHDGTKPGWKLCILDISTGKTKVILDLSKAPKSLGTAIGDAVFSPDGSKVLFAASGKLSVGEDPAESPLNNPHLDMWLLDRRTGKVKRLTNDGQGYSFIWSPDGRFIAAHGERGYVSPEIPPTESGRPIDDLYIIDSATGKSTMLGEDVSYEEWSSGGKYLYALFPKDDKARLFVWNSLKQRSKLLAEDVFNVQWSPNGRQLSFIKEFEQTKESYSDSKDTRLYAWNPVNGRTHLVSKKVDSSAWMPDSRHFLITRPGWKRVVSIPVTGGRDTFISGDFHILEGGEWSPDGSSFLYPTRNAVTWSYRTVQGLGVLSLKSKRCRQLLEKNDDFLFWSPDSKKVAGFWDSGLSYPDKIRIINIKSKSTVHFNSLGELSEPLGWTADSKAFIVMDDQPIKRKVTKKRKIPIEELGKSYDNSLSTILTIPSKDEQKSEEYEYHILSRFVAISAITGKVSEIAALPEGAGFRQWRMIRK